MVLRDEGDRSHLVDPLCTLYVLCSLYMLTCALKHAHCSRDIPLDPHNPDHARAGDGPPIRLVRAHLRAAVVRPVSWYAREHVRPGRRNAWHAVAGRVRVPWLPVAGPLHAWSHATDGAADGQRRVRRVAAAGPFGRHPAQFAWTAPNDYAGSGYGDVRLKTMHAYR